MNIKGYCQIAKSFWKALLASDKMPRFQINDEAPEITKAGEKVIISIEKNIIYVTMTDIHVFVEYSSYLLWSAHV